MKSNLADAVQAGLKQRNLEREPVYWMAITEAEAALLTQGIIPEEVQSMAAWLCEPLHTMAEKRRRLRDEQLLAAQRATQA